MSEPSAEERLPLTWGYGLLLTFAAQSNQLLGAVILGAATGKSSFALLGIATVVGYGIAFALAVPRIPPPPEFYLGVVRPPPIATVAALLLLPALLLTSEADNLINASWPAETPVTEESAADEEDTEANRVVVPEGLAMLELAVVLILVVPISFELLYRGLVQPIFVRALGPVGGIGVTALLGTLGYLLVGSVGPGAILQAFVLSLLFGLLRHASGSLLPGLLLHVGSGTAVIAALHGAFGIAGFDDMDSAHTPPEWLLPAAVSTGIGLGLCRSLLAARSLRAEGESGRQQTERKEDRE